MAKKTFPEEGVKDLAQLKIGDTADSRIIQAVTGQDPWDVNDDVTCLQASFCSDVIGNTRLFYTFNRHSVNDAWAYMGLCVKNSPINRSPSEARKVFICSPFAKDPEKAVRFARAACYEAFLNGCMPIAPHLYFTRFLHDGGDSFEREWGIAAGHELMRDCDDIFVYVIDNYISAGMRSDIEFAVNELAMQPTMIRMTARAAEEYMKEFLEDAEAFQGLKPAEE